MGADRKICVGQFAGAHGVRGLVKLRSFTEDPEAIFSYAPLLDEKGRELKITLKSSAKDHYLVTLAGIESKEQADDLRGDKIFIPRSLLPKTRKGEFYEADLIGLAAFDAAGKSYGTVLNVYDYGAGTFFEIGTGKKDSFMLPFKDAFVPEINIEVSRITIIVPEGWLQKTQEVSDDTDGGDL